MKIIEYEYHDATSYGWSFSRTKFGSINLLVGDTATGKSKFLNTIFSLGLLLSSRNLFFGIWDMIFEHKSTRYSYHIETGQRNLKGIVVNEKLQLLNENNSEILFERDPDNFYYMGQKMPKIHKEESGISIFRDEENIQPVSEAFLQIKRRLFSENALSAISNIQSIPPPLEEIVSQKADLNLLFQEEINVNLVLYFLEKYFMDIYIKIIEQYKEIFPFISDCKIRYIGDVLPSVPSIGRFPVFSIKEKNSENWIPLMELSSGMQKVLLIITDLNTIPNGGIYIIDEYENSLGINAIDFFPQYILGLDKKIQYFITSHHPYLINEIPINNWYIFNRKGMHVNIRYGDEIISKFSKSKQKAFIQLINDPWYSEGVE